jgi:hypothetical protein
VIVEVVAAPVVVVMVKEPLRAPAGIVIEAGTWALAVLLLVTVITAPAGGAAPFSVTVPREDEPSLTVVGFNTSEVPVTLAGFTVKLVVLVFPRYTAEIVTIVCDATPVVVIVKVAVVEPAATVTLAGT